MKIFFLLALLALSQCGTDAVSDDPSDNWMQVAGPGHGSFQEEWREGTFPLGIKPVIAFDSMLWMTGQKYSWSSPDGIEWNRYNKADWGERISLEVIYFKGKLWMFGGMKIPVSFQNDIWNTDDGKNWKQVGNASWSPRKGQTIVEYKNKLWLFGGADKVNAELSPSSFLNDIWSSDDGISWIQETASASWSPRDYCRVIIFRDSLWLIGGQGHADIWNSDDGKNWSLQTDKAPWEERNDHGALVYDNKVWVMGGWKQMSTNAFNDIWFTEDGKTWKNESAPWTPRTALNTSVVFKDKLWLFSGKRTGSRTSWSGDIWVMSK